MPREGERPVTLLDWYSDSCAGVGLLENAVRMMCGKPHTSLNMAARPIANKYHEGKLKSTLKREFIRACNCTLQSEWLGDAGIC